MEEPCASHSVRHQCRVWDLPSQGGASRSHAIEKAVEMVRSGAVYYSLCHWLYPKMLISQAWVLPPHRAWCPSVKGKNTSPCGTGHLLSRSISEGQAQDWRQLQDSQDGQLPVSDRPFRRRGDRGVDGQPATSATGTTLC